MQRFQDVQLIHCNRRLTGGARLSPCSLLSRADPEWRQVSISRLPSWFDKNVDYTEPRYHEALAFGRAAAKNNTWDWDVAEASLMEVWSLSPRQGKWWDVRGAVFYGWDEARLSFSSEGDAEDEDGDEDLGF